MYADPSDRGTLPAATTPLLRLVGDKALTALLALSCLLLFADMAAAQYPGSEGYSSPSYTGGSLVLHNGDGSVQTDPYTLNNGQYGYNYYASAGSNQTCTATASGTINYTSTWNGGTNNDPPPAAAIKTETCTVEYSTAYGSGSYSNPLAASGATPPSPAGSAWTCTQYTGINSPPATITDSLAGASASASGTAPVGYYTTASAGVYDAVSYAPVTITLTGPTKDSSGSQDILIGQKCTASLNGIPTGSGWTIAYLWKIPGNTFQSWNGGASPTPNSTTYTSGPGPLTNSTASWYWNDKAASETVSCTVTLTPPAGQGSTFTVTPTKVVYLKEPTWSGSGTGGTGLIDTSWPADPGVLGVYAGSTVAGNSDRGMLWTASVATPSPFSQSGGQWCYVQIASPNLDYTTGGTVHHDSNNGKTGLDGTFPYGSFYTPSTTPQTDGDAPGYSLSDADTNYTVNSSFHTYIMYEPPGGVWVSLGDMTWSWTASVNIPASGHWSDWPSGNSAGTISPATATFQRQLTPPAWTQILN